MPPRVTKRTPAGPGSKRAGRGRGAAKVQPEFHPEESNVRSEEEEVEEEKRPIAVEEKEIEPEEKVKTGNKQAEENEDASGRKSDYAKESVDEYEKDERLDLEDNDPEFEPEEYGGVDYDEKETEQDPREEGGEVEEDPEEVDVGEEEEGDVVEEEMEGVPEELEPEEDYERVEEHTEMGDAAEEDEHHEVFKERRKRKEFEIFVGGLDKDATESDLRKVFSEVGEVTEVRLMMNPQTKKNKGFAFLRFATVEQAKRACAELKNPVVHGKQCGVTPSQDSDTLFLGNICKTWTVEALKEKLKHYGVENIEDLTLVEDSNNVGTNRGFAFLEFSSRSDAMDAFKRLQKRDVSFGVDRPAKVSFADSFIDPGDEIMAQVKTVFVDGVSASWDEEYVKELLKKYGEIEKVELARNMPSARRKDFGFVTFDSHDAAVTCAKSINNEELGEGDNKAKVRARLSRPLQRGKGKHAARGDVKRGPIRGGRSPWARPVPRSIPARIPRGLGPRFPPVVDRGFKRPAVVRERRPAMAVPPRSRPVAPLPRSYDRRPPVPSYPKSGLKRDYVHREEIHPRSRAAVDYSTRASSDRRAPYRDDYPPRPSGYPDLPRGGSTSRSTGRRAYVDDGYSQRYERPPPTYREGRGREYDSVSGSKRPYAAVDDAPPRYSEAGMRHSRARLDYDLGGSASHYGDAYGDRLGRSNLGYGASRSSLSSHDTHGLYSSRQGMGYGGGPYGGSDAGGMYSSSFGGDYMSRGSDVGGGSYSSLYPGRGLGGNSYMGSSGSGSYY
ncbi:Heterogeneous nuclear ribonucleoprotein R (RRM superfamily) [Handroanthus impetiginosus]|uniref:Heterogeneous nuclear ribonucleoprotein R (RRM superfamily) n=1 Tax=Handroanthus impetiginosus TaxID=429701 RepID=A0A2G9HMI7_9LAMI|nr:Heterogeneous nuclear ribonucleoprotein R (RRM superfamily) [Handroanthus impetiginosus]